MKGTIASVNCRHYIKVFQCTDKMGSSSCHLELGLRYYDVMVVATMRTSIGARAGPSPSLMPQWLQPLRHNAVTAVLGYMRNYPIKL